MKKNATLEKASKPQLQLVPPALNNITAPAMEEGARKYGLCSWRKGPLSLMEMIGAIRRHTDALLRGEWVDPASTTEKTHLGGVAASVAIIGDAHEAGVLVDDRPVVVDAPPGLERRPPETPAAQQNSTSPDLEFTCGCGHTYGDHAPSGCTAVRIFGTHAPLEVPCICNLSGPGVST